MNAKSFHISLMAPFLICQLLLISPARGETSAGWKKSEGNPVMGTKWLLWYNGRHGRLEQIGVVLHEGEDLGFD